MVAKPRALRPGNTIAIVSPSSGVTTERIAPGIALLESQGYKVRLMPHADGKLGYLSGTAEERAADLQAAFDAPDIDAVMCSRGGYGSVHLLPLLDLDRIAASGKLFVGYSDITTLHLALNKRGMTTVHGSMVVTFEHDRPGYVAESWLNVLAGKDPIPANSPKGETVVPGVAEAELVGGNLTLICDAMGTDHSLDTEGKILLIEETEEDLYRIDARFTHMKNAGLFRNIEGLVIGDMTETDARSTANGDTQTWRELVRGIVEPLDVPTVFGFPFGHNEDPLSLPLNVKVRLNASEGSLSYPQAFVAGHTE